MGKLKTNIGEPDMADELDSALTGAAFELANAGYEPMADSGKKNENETIGSDKWEYVDRANLAPQPKTRID